MDFLLTDAQWGASRHYYRAGRARAGAAARPRRFVEAVLWLTRNGCRWRHQHASGARKKTGRKP